MKDRVSSKMDDGRAVQIDPVKHPHLDHGYAVTGSVALTSWSAVSARSGE